MFELIGAPGGSCTRGGQPVSFVANQFLALTHNKALQPTHIPLRSMWAAELGR